MNTILEQINSAGYVFVEFALPMLAQSSVLIVVLLLADLLLRKKVRAVFRYWLWMLVLLKLVLPTTLSSPVSLGSWFGDELATVKFSESTSAEPVSSPQMAQALSAEETVTPTTAAQDTEPVVAEVTASLAVSPPLTWQGTAFLLWAAVAVAMGLLLLQRVIFVCGLVAQAQNPTELMKDAFRFCCGQMGLKGKVGLKVSANTTSPAVCGLFRPVILVPENLAPTLGAGHLRTVLLHELAHIKRGDLWINLAQTVLQIIYFYNPLLWLANSIIRRIREQAVDEAVQVAMGDKARQYPQTLVDVAKMALSRPALSLRLIGVVESKSALKGRIKRMLTRPIPKTAKLGVLGLAAILLVGCILLPMAKAQEQQAKTKYSFVTVTEGLGFDDFIIGDANCTAEFIKSKLGEPDEEVKNGKDWWLNYIETYGLDFWLSPKENVLKEIRLNKGFKGRLTSGISISSTKQDVLDVYGEPLEEKEVRDLTKHFENQTLYKKQRIFGETKNSKIFYTQHGLLFWFEGDKILQIVIHPKEDTKVGAVDIAVGDFAIRPSREKERYYVVASIRNSVDVTIPAFRLNFYRTDPSRNLDEGGHPHSGHHGAGPIEPGNVWNERSSDFALDEGINEFFVVLDIDEQVAESDELNNRASMKVVVEDGRIIEKSVSYSPQPKVTSSGPRTNVQSEIGRASKVSDKDKMASENLASEGWALWRQRKLTEAEKAFEKAVSKDPKNANAWNGLGWAQQNQGKPLNAKASFEKCLQIQPKHAAALNGLGWIAKEQGDTDKAIGYWEKAIKAAPAATAALNGLATTYMELKQFDKAVKYYRMWLKVEPDNPDAKTGLEKAKSEGTKGKSDQAAEKENSLRVYEVNRNVADFPKEDDFSTPEAAYATINRVSASGENAGWIRVSVKRLAKYFANQKDKGKRKDSEWAKVLLNTTILEVHILSENRAVVVAELPQQFSSKPIVNPIDVRYLELEDGRWLNTGNDRFATIEQVRAKFSRFGNPTRQLESKKEIKTLPRPSAEMNQLNEAVYKQLDEIVDLSGLTSDMSFKRALDELKYSVDPPLNIVVLWTDLFENADIDQATPIGMDAIPAVRLSMALKLLLNSVSGNFAELDYAVEDGVIFIATIEALPTSFETKVYDISDLVGSAADADDIAMLVIHTVEPDLWEGAGGGGTVTTHNKKLIVYQTHGIHKQIQDLLQNLQVSPHEQGKSKTEMQ